MDFIKNINIIKRAIADGHSPEEISIDVGGRPTYYADQDMRVMPNKEPGDGHHPEFYRPSLLVKEPDY